MTTRGYARSTEWLNEALTERERVWKKAGKPPINNERILVLEIRGFPERAVPHYKPARGWFYQLYAPLSTMLGVWTSGQQATNATELDLMIKYWGQKGVEIVPVVFQPDAAVYEKKGILPLSWHLRDEDKQLIEEAWNFECLKKSNCQTVTDFVGIP